MRITKAELQRALDTAARFNGLELVYYSTIARGVEEHIRNLRGFMPACWYGRGMFPLRGEIGCVSDRRFLARTT